jgi:hypothetical protein
MERYIMTFEDGQHYIATEVTQADKDAISEGILSVIRCSDAKELHRNGEWVELDKWGE